MQWFKKPRQYMPVHQATRRKSIPDGLWKKCVRCQEILYIPELERRLNVCDKCNYHFRVSAQQRIQYLTDEGSFEETHAELTSADPLGFTDPSGSYADRISEHQKATGLKDAAVTGFGEIGSVPASLAVTDYFFMMGSMGSVVG